LEFEELQNNIEKCDKGLIHKHKEEKNRNLIISDEEGEKNKDLSNKLIEDKDAAEEIRKYRQTQFAIIIGSDELAIIMRNPALEENVNIIKYIILLNAKKFCIYLF